MKRWLILGVVAALLLAASCAKATPVPVPLPKPGVVSPEGGIARGLPGPIAPSGPSGLVERLIIRTGNMTLRVESLPSTLEKIAGLAEGLGGYVVSSGISGEEAGSITIRVLAEKFSEAMSSLRKLAVRVEAENTSSQDVTEEYTDLNARLRNLEATEAQLLEFLRKAEKMEDVLLVFKELSQVRENIETIKGRVQFLERSSALAMISVQLLPATSPKPIVAPGWSGWEVVKEALRGLAGLGRALATGGIWVVVFSPLWLAALAVIFFSGRRLLRKLRGD